MQFLKDLISSMYKHIDTRINSPILGTLSAIFVILYWDKFTLLFWGTGTIDSRVTQFKSFLTGITTSEYLLIAFLILAYLFLLPLVNYLTGLIQGEIEHIRYCSSINQKVKKEKERARLINSKYKAEHESEIAAQEIIEEIAFSNEKIEQQKTLTEDIKERSKASSVIIKAMYEKSQKIKIELETSIKEKQAAEIKLSREAMSREREKMSYDKLKYQIEEKKKISQLSSAFYLINKLDLILTADSIKISLSGLGAVIASVFGYTSFTKLLEDENFNTDSLEAIDYIIYSESLITDIKSIIEDENIDEDTDSYTLFEHLQNIFEEDLNIKILTQDEVSEKIRDNLEENGMYDLIHCDEVSGSIAETNAYFEYVENLQIIDSELTDESFKVKFECILSGTTHEDKPYCGEEIDVSFTNKSKIILGKFAIGEAEIEEIGSSVKDYHEEDDYEPQEISSTVNEKKYDNEF
ncbi:MULTISPECIES: hypothetical protein [Enterobacteriaceae]|nr:MULTISPECIES: hypothetical protein [Enterobacteriaceae]ELD3313394.1 hypothetical protein [Enterobacter hormaechei]ELD3471344.1 hypothetical protein [Enterobacter hormaechei]ELP2769918.1 hypothetical protein [Klebsiella pneumoniae]EMD6837878.1 hypothetical protein [Klebsiella pneumoniae]MBS0810053.1 hypothetical protein [Enterobacter hormaechei]